MDWKQATTRGPYWKCWGTGPATGRAPLYRRQAHALRSAIRRGDLPPGLRLPPERSLARLLSLSRSTVVAAYDALEHDRLVERRQGSGTRVRERQSERASAERATVAQALSRNTLFRRIADGPDGTIDFLGASLLGGEGLPAAVLEGLDHELANVSQSSGYAPLGHPPLRQAIASQLTRSGLPTAPEQVLVTSGAQQAIHLAAWHYLHHGHTAVVENPQASGLLCLQTNIHHSSPGSGLTMAFFQLYPVAAQKPPRIQPLCSSLDP